MSRACCSHAGGNFGAFVNVDAGGDEIGGGVWAAPAVEMQATSSAEQRMVRIFTVILSWCVQLPDNLTFRQRAPEILNCSVAELRAPGQVKPAKSDDESQLLET